VRNLARYTGSAALVALIVSLGGAISGLPGSETFVDDYNEECVNEAPCSQEELRELGVDYTEECVNEGCRAEEVVELAGTADAAPAMLEHFEGRGIVVKRSDFEGLDCVLVEHALWPNSCRGTCTDGRTCFALGDEKYLGLIPEASSCTCAIEISLSKDSQALVPLEPARKAVNAAGRGRWEFRGLKFDKNSEKLILQVAVTGDTDADRQLDYCQQLLEIVGPQIEARVRWDAELIHDGAVRLCSGNSFAR
jgi:hypothetical protein